MNYLTPLGLQDALIDELKEIFKEYAYKTPPKISYPDPDDPEHSEIIEGDKVPINIYPQHIPVSETDDEDDPVPYLLVRLNTGDDDGSRSSNNVVNLVIIAGIFDDDKRAQGHRDVSNIIQKIYERFSKNPNLRNVAAYTGEFHWQLQEDNYFPYFFGACSISFNIAAIRREDEYA